MNVVQKIFINLYHNIIYEYQRKKTEGEGSTKDAYS